MKVRKSNKFENAYIVDIFRSVFNSAIHILFETAKTTETEQGKKIAVCYLSYNRYRSKWYEDVLYISPEVYSELEQIMQKE